MFLRCTRRVKNGKTHAYWNLVENRRLAHGRVAQRQVLYLGEINASQCEAWRKTIEIHEHGVLQLLRLSLPKQPPPKIAASQIRQHARVEVAV